MLFSDAAATAQRDRDARARRAACARWSRRIALCLLSAALACGGGGGGAPEPDATEEGGPVAGGAEVDFLVSGLMAAPVSLMLTDSITIDAVIENTGIEVSGPFQVRAYLKEGTNCDFATFLMGEQSFDLLGGESAPFQVSRVIDNVTGPGTYYVCLHVDAGNQVSETDETNNWVGQTSVPVSVIDCATALDCDDANACTDDACTPGVGCTYTNNTAPCDDGLYCTVGDTCATGRCEPGLPRECVDANLCDGTLFCDEEQDLCVNGQAPPPCDDGNPCNGSESCNPTDALCVAGTPMSCDAFFHNGQAPPLASNVIDDASYDEASAQRVLLRDLGCPLFDEAESFCPVFGVGTTVEVTTGAQVGDLRVFDTSTLVVTDGDVEQLWAEQDSTVQIAGGRVASASLDADAAITGGAHPFIALHGAGDMQGGAVADLELASAHAGRRPQMSGGVVTTLFLGADSALRGGRVSVICARDESGVIYGTGFDATGGQFGPLPGDSGFVSGLLESGETLYAAYRQNGEPCHHPLEGVIATASGLQVMPPPSTFIANGLAPPFAENVIDAADTATALHDVVVRNAGCPDGWPAAMRDDACTSPGAPSAVEVLFGASLPGELRVLDGSTAVIRGGAMGNLRTAAAATIEVWGDGFTVGGSPVAPGEVVATSGVLGGNLASGEVLALGFDREDPALPGQYGTIVLRTAAEIPSGMGVAHWVLGGSTTPGGVSLELDVETAGTLFVEHDVVPVQDLGLVVPDPEGLAIAAGGIQGSYRIWQMDFTGELDLEGTSRVTLGFDPGEVQPGQQVGVYAWNGEAWQRITDNVVVDTVLGTIAFDITGFDTFALIIRDFLVPALSTLGLLLLVAAMIGAALASTRRRRSTLRASLGWGVLWCAMMATGEAEARSRPEIPQCTYAALHAGLCVDAHAGRLVHLIDASGSATDRCVAEGQGGGSDRVLCRHEAGDWREVVRRRNGATSFAAASAPQRVLHILNPPPGSGLVPPVGDGIDGEPEAPRTNDAPAISAAIQYACENGYDIAYLGPGVYRVGEADTSASFYTGVGIDAQLCPNGIRFYGAGAGRTILLANGNQGQYLVFTADDWSDATRVERIGFRPYGYPADVNVTNVTSGVTPPVVTGSGDPMLDDGDLVHARNCSGTSAMNERRFRVNACTSVAPFSCELQDEDGVDIDASDWGTWNADTACILNKLNDDFEVEIAYMTLRDDAPAFHAEVCNPTCVPALEQSHGIGILQGGGAVEIHHLVIDGIGDEAIDVSTPEGSVDIHDVSILDPEVSGVSIYQGVGIRVEDVFIYKGTPWASFLSNLSQGEGVTIDPGTKNWRVVDVAVERVAIGGGFRFGMAFETNSTGFEGQYVSGVRVENVAVSLTPNPALCAGGGQQCGAVQVRTGGTALPMEAIEVRESALSGTVLLEVEAGAGGVVLAQNTLLPIAGIDPKWGVRTSSLYAEISDNTISGFPRGCIAYLETQTQGGAHATVTTEIARNQLACVSNPGNQDAMVTRESPSVLVPGPGDEAYLRIIDNTVTAAAGTSIRRGIVAGAPGGEVRVCGNQISLDPSIAIAGSAGIDSDAPGAVICDNSISLEGHGVRVAGDDIQVVGNIVSGDDAPSGRGVYVDGASNVLVKGNTIQDYDAPFATGVLVQATTAPATGVRVIGNSLASSGVGIDADGNGQGLSGLVIAGNRVDLEDEGGRTAIRLHDTSDTLILLNDLVGLSGTGADALVTSGSSDFNTVRDNVAEGGGTLRYGTGAGDASCNPTGGVGANSTCADNTLQ